MPLRFPLRSGLRFLAPAALTLGAAFAAMASSVSGCDSGSTADASTGNTTASSGGGGQGNGTGGSGNTGGAGTGGSGGEGPCDPALAVCACDNGVCPDSLLCIDDLCLAGCDFSYQCGPGKVCANGQCVVGCGPNNPCAEPGTTCEKGVCVPDPQNPACDDQTPCPEAGEVCVEGVCAAPCDVNDDCPEGEACNDTTGACIPDPFPQPSCRPVGSMCGGVNQTCMEDGYCHYSCMTTQECKLIDNRFEACDMGVCKTIEEIAPECTLNMPCPDGLDCISNECL